MLRFNVWHVKDKRMYEVESVFWHKKHRKIRSVRVHERDDNISIGEVTLLDYTGFRDRKNCPIIVGDIVEISDIDGEKIQKVEWIQGFGCFNTVDSQGKAYHIVEDNYYDLDMTDEEVTTSHLKVIGNVFEDVELLKSLNK